MIIAKIAVKQFSLDDRDLFPIESYLSVTVLI